MLTETARNGRLQLRRSDAHLAGRRRALIDAAVAASPLSGRACSNTANAPLTGGDWTNAFACRPAGGQTRPHYPNNRLTGDPPRPAEGHLVPSFPSERRGRPQAPMQPTSGNTGDAIPAGGAWLKGTWGIKRHQPRLARVHQARTLRSLRPPPRCPPIHGDSMSRK